MAMIHVSRSGAQLGVFEEEKVRAGLVTGEFLGTDLGWTEGMATWRSLSELDSFRTPPTPPPVQPPVAAMTPVVSPAAAAGLTSARTGLPWENRQPGNMLNAFFETLSLIFTKPAEAFTIMKRDAGLGDPLLYALICGSVGAIVAFGFSFALQGLGIGIGGRSNPFASIVGLGFGAIVGIILIPITIIIGTFIAAAIIHVCLMIVGGAKQSFETTLRVVCFGGGSANLLQIIPICGGYIAFAVSLGLNIIGLARAHETDTWRAVVAVFLPLVVCCGGGAVLFALILAGAAGANWH